MIELKLDYNTWKCGGDPFDTSDAQDYPNVLGKGQTLLLNKNGYMCCLGQFASQLGVDTSLLKGAGEPDEINIDDTIVLLTKRDDMDRIRNTDFSKKAIEINDNKRTTPLEKIAQLKALCKLNDILLTVINLPKK